METKQQTHLDIFRANCLSRHVLGLIAAPGHIDQAFAMVEQPYTDTMMENRCAILVLAGAFSEALKLLEARLCQSPQDAHLRFTRATCLLHLERYDDAIAAYEQVIAEEGTVNAIACNLPCATSSCTVTYGKNAIPRPHMTHRLIASRLPNSPTT